MKQEKHLSADELFDYCLKEYDSNNKLVKKLFENFFSKIEDVVKSIPQNARILEVGCGAAESSSRLFKMLKNQHFEASEYDERYITKLNTINLPFIITQESVYEMRREDNSFDCIFLLEVLEHLEFPEKAKKELYRVSRKNVVISVPNEPIWKISNILRGKYIRFGGNTPGHINHYSARSLSKFFSSHFDIIKIYKPFPWLIIILEKKLQ